MAIEIKPIESELNWPAFYQALVQLAPWAMTGLPDGVREYILICGQQADAFWSDDLQDSVSSLWESSPALAVNEAMEVFCHNVRRAFSEMPLTMAEQWIPVPAGATTFTREACINCIDFKLTDPIRDFLLAAGREPEA